MKNMGYKFKIGMLVALLSIGVPALIQLILSIVFADYYEHGGFLPGLGHYFISTLMIIFNLIFAPMIIFLNFPDLDNDHLENVLLKRITFIFIVSVIVQIAFCIWMENPFSPSTPDFPF